MSTQVTKDDDFIVFSRDFSEFYDVRISQLATYMPQMRLKNWFTPEVEEKVLKLIENQ
jgi:hypothetical protein